MSDLRGAACADLSPKQADALFFGPGHSNTAKRLCMGCPVRVECALVAIELEEAEGFWRFGVWGGLLPAERRRMAAQRKQRVGVG